jgi:prevent-host-death family protein
MKNEVSIAEAKAKFSELVNRAAYGGERIVITKRGRPIAVLSPPSVGGLGSVKGWLNEQDPFFRDIEAIERKRHQTSLRASKKSSHA